MTLLAAAALLAWAYLLLAHGRFWPAGPVLAPVRPPSSPPVDVVVPARDEADGHRGLPALAAGAGLCRAAAGHRGGRRQHGRHRRHRPRASSATTPAASCSTADRPPGWSGKLWAVAQGVAASDAPLVLLCDADIVHDPAHVATLVAKAERGGLDLVSEMVELNCASPAERALVPAFVFFFQMLYPFARVNDPTAPPPRRRAARCCCAARRWTASAASTRCAAR